MPFGPVSIVTKILIFKLVLWSIRMVHSRVLNYNNPSCDVSLPRVPILHSIDEIN